MAAVNSRRVLLGALAGGVVWNIWSIILYVTMLSKRYMAAQESGFYLKQPRYPAFPAQWIVLLFILAYIVSWLYASARATRGASAGTAITIGFFVGFAAGFPSALANSVWSPVSRYVPLGQLLEMWVGAILAALVAGWVYRD
jgi:hypothetical protein